MSESDVVSGVVGNSCCSRLFPHNSLPPASQWSHPLVVGGGGGVVAENTTEMLLFPSVYHYMYT